MTDEPERPAVHYWILDEDGRTPKRTTDPQEWFQWQRKRGRVHVGWNSDPERDVTVSTVFLFMELTFHPEAEPRLFETMIFGGEHSMFRVKVSTWDKALENHIDACKLAGLQYEPLPESGGFEP
jgi:hypothetical protein